MIHPIGANAADSAGGAVHLRFKHDSISWAGEGSRPDELCFGTEGGELIFVTVDGVPTRSSIAGVSDPESVNGVAFIGSVIAVSNRREIEFWQPIPGRELAERAIFPHGAHGVIAVGGFFIAPLGPSGMMKANAGQGEQQWVTVSQSPQQPFNYYKVAHLEGHDGLNLLACAVRHGGILLTELAEHGDQTQIRSLTFSGLDVVDVCALGVGKSAPSVAALGRDGTLILMSNLLNDLTSIPVRLPRVTGTAYGVFCVQGNILVLTSTGLFILAGLASRFLDGEPVDRTSTVVRELQLEAVDANLCWDRWLAVVLPDQVLILDLGVLTAGLPDGEPTKAERSVSPPLPRLQWEPHPAMTRPEAMLS